MLPIAKPYEKIEYKGKKYPIETRFIENDNLWPFGKFIKNRPELFYPGYIAHWRLENDCLYLTQLEYLKLTKEEIFNSSEPVFCNWFSGEIEFGIGESNGSSYKAFANHIWLKIEEGKVIEKKIISLFNENPIINFGKYKETRFYGIVEGKMIRFDDGSIYGYDEPIKEYIKGLLLFFCNYKFEYKIQTPYFNIDEESVKLIKSLKSIVMEFLVAKNYVAINPMYDSLNDPNIEIAQKLSLFIEEILSSDFSTSIVLTKSELEDKDIFDKSFLLNPDIEYLNWIIKEVNSFSIPPHLLIKEFNLKILKTIKIKRLNNLVFEYEPVVEHIKYKFPEHILNINQNKFEKKNLVKYDSINNLYETIIIKNSTIETYKNHFINEDLSQIPEMNDDRYYDDNDLETFEDYNGSYAQDYENYSDQFIDDVFDGDPDNYWNID